MASRWKQMEVLFGFSLTIPFIGMDNGLEQEETAIL